MRALLIWLARWLPEPRVIYDREGGTAYLSRWYLLRTRPAVDLDNVQTGRAGLRGQSGETSAPRRFDLFLHQAMTPPANRRQAGERESGAQ